MGAIFNLDGLDMDRLIESLKRQIESENAPPPRIGTMDDVVGFVERTPEYILELIPIEEIEKYLRKKKLEKLGD